MIYSFLFNIQLLNKPQQSVINECLRNIFLYHNDYELLVLWSLVLYGWYKATDLEDPFLFQFTKEGNIEVCEYQGTGSLSEDLHCNRLCQVYLERTESGEGCAKLMCGQEEPHTCTVEEVTMKFYEWQLVYQFLIHLNNN